MTEKLPIEYQFTNYSNIYLSFRQRSQKVNDSRTGEFLLLIIFGNQFIVSTIKFRKGFSKFMIQIALLEKFGR